MIRNRSVRFQLTAWYALILLAALTLFGGLLWFSLRHSLLAEADRDIASRADQFVAYTIREAGEGETPAQLKDELDEFCQALPPSSALRLRGSNGFAFDYPPSAKPPRPGATLSLHRRFATLGETYNLDLTTSLQDIRHTMELVQTLLLSLLPVVVAIAALGGAWLSRRALKPVDDITRAALSTGIDNLSLRLPVPPTGDELQRLTEAWNATLARLESAVGTLSQFAADASHELRTPLSVIRTSAELALRRARTPEAYRESLTDIAAEAERMTQLVEDLLLLARTDAQAAGMPKEPLDLKQLLAETAEHVRGIAQLRQIRIRTAWPEGGPFLTGGNRPALRRLFLVLLDNAIKYSRPRSEVIVSLEESAGELVAAVEDFGCGIGAADRPHIFQRFYQADAARRDGGFGLGLSLAQSIARAHAASIDVSAEDRIGSKFSVRLQAAQPLAAYHACVPAAPASNPIEGRQPSPDSLPLSSSVRGTPSGFEAPDTTLPL